MYESKRRRRERDKERARQREGERERKRGRKMEAGRGGKKRERGRKREGERERKTEDTYRYFARSSFAYIALHTSHTCTLQVILHYIENELNLCIFISGCVFEVSNRVGHHDLMARRETGE